MYCTKEDDEQYNSSSQGIGSVMVNIPMLPEFDSLSIFIHETSISEILEDFTGYNGNYLFVCCSMPQTLRWQKL